MTGEHIECDYCGYINNRKTIIIDNFKNGFFYVRCGNCNGAFAIASNAVVFKYSNDEVLKNKKEPEGKEKQ